MKIFILSNHAKRRKIERNILYESIENAFLEPLYVGQARDNRKKYIGKAATIIVVLRKEKPPIVVTTYPTSPKLRLNHP